MHLAVLARKAFLRRSPAWQSDRRAMCRLQVWDVFAGVPEGLRWRQRHTLPKRPQGP